MIEEYMQKEDMKQATFAKKADISRQLLHWHLKNPRKSWSRENAEKIVKAIYGEVIKEKVIALVLGY